MIQTKQLMPMTLVVAALATGFYAQDFLALIKSSNDPIDLSQYCYLSSENCTQGDMSAQLEQNVLHPLKPTVLSVTWPNSDAEQLRMELSGMEMEMGTLRFKLAKNEEGIYQGVLLLPVCTTDSMTWLGTITGQDHKMNVAIRMER
ncbi:hypothetical protein [Vibrio tapetis]|uniref:Uncharacterized protein n=1 Tax=Vibrio tapetis subsp. tapetis TaxID=1671868 RepID=A0A2N8ZK27_9VIBR|nr:hypothetical protein [Vibrio tapetis]SON52269.1 conserved protein of unknown function [Vibrio tapetis subsp. tapetis]